MKYLRLDTILLFALLVPFIMNFRLSPGTTPYWLFGIIFFGLFLYAFVDLPFTYLKKLPVQSIKLSLLWILIFLSIGAGMLAAIIVRHQTAPVYNVHDIILQQEAAIRFFLHGVNPYATTYFNTPLAQWHYSDTAVNPALYHFVMQPLYLLFPTPFYLAMGHTLGFFDARVPLFVLFIAILIMGQFLITDKDKKREFLVLFAFNPANISYFLEGRDDIFMFAFFFAALILLYKKRFVWGGILLACAFAVKQSIWPFFPFYVLFLFYSFSKQFSFSKAVRQTLIYLISFAVTFLVLVTPFFLWNSKAFLDSTIFYLSGNTAHSYPIAGYGLGMLLNEFGVIKNVNSYYPFWIWQVIVCFPLLVFFLWFQKKHNTIPMLLVMYSLFLFVFWYTSRYFNNSHLGFLSLVFITAYYWPPEFHEKA